MAWISERCGLVRCFLGRFAFDQNFTAFSKRGQVIRTFPEKVSGENLRIVEFLIANHATENTVSKIKMERNLRQDSFVNLGIPLEIVLFWGNFWKCCSTRHWKCPEIHVPEAFVELKAWAPSQCVPVYKTIQRAQMVHCSSLFRIKVLLQSGISPKQVQCMAQRGFVEVTYSWVI